MTHSSAARRRPGWWYPFIFVGAFGVVLIVNLFFMASAIRTFSGISTENAYEKGLNFNERAEQVRAQERLGWTVKADVQPSREGRPHSADIVVSVTGKDGRPMTGLQVAAAFVRPTVAGHDSAATFVEQGEGRYKVTAALELGGQWDMSVTAKRGDDVYWIAQRVYLP
jgi:nitrogen fixation protein FixH